MHSVPCSIVSLSPSPHNPPHRRLTMNKPTTVLERKEVALAQKTTSAWASRQAGGSSGAGYRSQAIGWPALRDAKSFVSMVGRCGSASVRAAQVCGVGGVEQNPSTRSLVPIGQAQFDQTRQRHLSHPLLRKLVPVQNMMPMGNIGQTLERPSSRRTEGSSIGSRLAIVPGLDQSAMQLPHDS